MAANDPNYIFGFELFRRRLFTSLHHPLSQREAHRQLCVTFECGGMKN
jgi:hypothetical protein